MVEHSPFCGLFVVFWWWWLEVHESTGATSQPRRMNVAAIFLFLLVTARRDLNEAATKVNASSLCRLCIHDAVFILCVLYLSLSYTQ